MPNLYAQLHRRYGKPDGITRREMIAAIARRRRRRCC